MQQLKLQYPIQKTINSKWRFAYFPSPDIDEAAAAREYDDNDWIPIAIPHTWSTYETTGELHPFIRNPSEKDNTYWRYGWGWYRKKLSISPEHRNKKIFIEFDGVMKYCRIYMNGHTAGEHKGGYMMRLPLLPTDGSAPSGFRTSTAPSCAGNAGENSTVVTFRFVAAGILLSHRSTKGQISVINMYVLW
ncbi:sugar-binding domain-containing protein [Paenibacillus radicis (ex Xue et al. 2023)]|uniref:Glycosyl hydrolases family 2 sugar binding domain-containing protein n=1 Tax=Paenibacillus radicis (ex Xue et al. 2023) TaxID=2972489 RepID=A0ABT1YQ85_9BACL|nr:sugar-binding domain-containing protein [Paenibacillus radicis (ex Xue et al. 2023)]MCR8635344.1 hypothetical protein [Paenibacillus radicis (ex Xue et al. 2023)]